MDAQDAAQRAQQELESKAAEVDDLSELLQQTQRAERAAVEQAYGAGELQAQLEALGAERSQLEAALAAAEEVGAHMHLFVFLEVGRWWWWVGVGGAQVGAWW